MRLAIRGRNAGTILLVLGVLFPTAASSQTWEYRTHYDGTTTLRSDTRAAPGYITLDESGGKPIFELHIANATPCFRGPIDAKVDRTAETTTITVKRDLKGCGSARFIVKNDGSGGHREIIREGKWVWDGTERGLTLKK